MSDTLNHKNHVVIALGCNLGNKIQNLKNAIIELQKNIKIEKCSDIFSNKALLPENAPTSWDINYFNLVFSGYTSLLPEDLLKFTQQIEKEVSNHFEKQGIWAPRKIDIDIISYNNDIIETPSLIIPHPQMHKRNFVLFPLAQIIPDWKYPNLNSELADKTSVQLAGQIDINFQNIIDNGPDFLNFESAEIFNTKINILQQILDNSNSKTQIFTILNITPDSFSDGGKNFAEIPAIQNIEKLIASGANYIDIGAQSTRPNAQIISADEEISRLENIFSYTKQNSIKAIFSIDTFYPQVAQVALQNGFSIINDVSGFNNPDMISLAAQSDCKVILMHSLTVPADKAINIPENQDVIKVLKDFLVSKIKILSSAGIKKENIIFDVGLGFGKTINQSIEILKRIDELKAECQKLDVPLFVGHSEKSFLTYFTDKPAGQRIFETTNISNYLSSHGVDFIRVHNFEANYIAINQPQYFNI